MPEFTTVSITEAHMRTIPGRQGRYLNEYVDYIQQVSSGQAGKLHASESEKPLTIRRRLVVAAKAMNIPLTIKRSGEDVYFWKEDEAGEQPRPRRGRRGRRQEDTAMSEQPFSEPEKEIGESELD
jgi:hypothetical protein